MAGLPHFPKDYWSLTSLHHAKATRLLSTSDDDDLIYACLELRKSLEAYTYSILRMYAKELPLQALQTWQPDKVMRELLLIDPRAGSDATFSIQSEPVGAEPQGEWIRIGTDRRLPLRYVRKAYHTLGNFLHVPTAEQERPVISEVRKRAQAVHGKLTEVLAPGRIICNFSGPRVTTFCTECETPVIRREPFLRNGGVPECGNCGQQFDVEIRDDEFYFAPKKFDWKCPRCDGPDSISQHKAIAGLDVTCRCCAFPIKLGNVISWRIYHAKLPKVDGGPPVEGA